MLISSRGQLIELINTKGVETYPIHADDDRKVLNTIIHCKKNNEFHRIAWGEVKDENDMLHLWYDEEVKKVKLDRGSGFWLTKEEMKEAIEKRTKSEIGANIKEVSLYNVKDNLVFINGLNTELKEEDGFNSVQVVGGAAGSGKSEYVLREAAKTIKKDESVLLFSTDETPQQIIKRLVRILAPNAYRKFEKRALMDSDDLIELNEALQLLLNSKLTIENNYLIDDNYILNKMEEIADSEDGLDLVVIDYLRLGIGTENHQAIIGIHEKMDVFRQKLGCKVIITTQLNRSFHN